MDGQTIRSWVRFIASIISISIGIMLLVLVVGLILGWSGPDQYFNVLFYVSAALLIIGGYSIQSSWSGIRSWSFAMSQTASEASPNERAKSEIRDINQAVGVWGKLSLVGGLILAITIIAR